MIYHQSTTATPRRNNGSVHLPECTECGAIDTMNGAPGHDGRWVWEADIVFDLGFLYDSGPAWRERVTADLEITRLVDGRCQRCRKGGS